MTLGFSTRVTLGGCLFLLLLASAINSSSAQTTVAVSADVPAGTSCASNRTRKAWEAYTDAEKTLYVAAVADAISRGYQQKFVELHTEYWSEAEAHRTCVFIYWHRMYLLGYENMLRSLKPEYACLTLPVWDHLSLSANYAASSCKSLQACSPILTALGGVSTWTSKSNIIYNVTIPYSTSSTSGARCVTTSPVSGFCGNSTTCSKCIVRGTVAKTYPSDALFGSVYQQLFTSNSWVEVSNQTERGVHDKIHSALGGTMAYFQSPADPIFFTHHAFVDALQVIYLKCQLGEEGLTLTADQKSSDPRFWTSCARRTGGNFSASDTITMRARAASNSSTWVDVRTSPDNTLYPFFKDLPGTYQQYIDAKDLGKYNYTYSISGGLANLYTNCRGANNITAVTSTETTTLMESSARSHACPRPTILPSTTEDVVMQYWTIAIFEAAKIVGYTDDAAREQMELIMCQHKQECLGGVDDYTDLFRTNFMVEGHPRCYTLIRDLKAGDRVIGVPKWRSITARFLPCNNRKRLIIRSSIE